MERDLRHSPRPADGALAAPECRDGDAGDRLFRLLVQAVQDYAIFLLDPEGRIASWNRGAERLKGYAAEEVLGRHVSVLYPEEDRRRGHPDETLQQAAERGRFEEEGWRVRKDGSRFWAHEVITAVHDEAGRLVGFGKVTQDLTAHREAERALRESEDRYRVLVNMLPQHVWTTDPDGSHDYFSRRTYEYTGATPEQTRGERWLDLLHPDDREPTLARWRHSLRTGEPYSIEYRVRSARGEFRWFLAQAMPRRNEAGGIVAWFGTLTDIDDQKRAAEAQRFLSDAGRALASSLDYEQTLGGVARLAVPALADWCVVDLVEPDGRIRRVEVAHRDPEKAVVARAVRGQPRDPAGEGGVPEVIRTGQPELVPQVSGEWLARATGVDEELFRLASELGTRSVMIAPLRARGRTLGAITLIAGESGRRYDARDLVLAESLADRAALAVDNARLYREAERSAREERALRVAVGAVGATFTTGEVIRQIAASAVDATGADSAFVTRIHAERGEVEVVALAGDIPPPLAASVAYADTYTRKVTEHRESVLIHRLVELRGPLREGPLASACPECSALVVPLHAELPIGALFLLREPERPDFSVDEISRAHTFGELAALAFRKLQLLEESERRRDELERITESRARLMRGFSHDVKNPLGAADGYAQLLEDGIQGALSEKQKESVRRIRRSIGTSLRLIHDLLELARAEAGQIELQRAPTNVAGVAREVAEDFRGQAAAKGLALEIHTPDALLTETDTTRVRQVLGNLLSNAVKYTAEGRVTVAADARGGGEFRTGDWIPVSVTDTGPGIPEANRERIFQEFTRLDPEAQQGAGVGLAISRRIARLLGGDITLRSEVGHGSTFTLWLPRTSPETGSSELAPASADAPRA
jgi:PAS domain S-box-containing protein